MTIKIWLESAEDCPVNKYWFAGQSIYSNIIFPELLGLGWESTSFDLGLRDARRPRPLLLPINECCYEWENLPPYDTREFLFGRCRLGYLIRFSRILDAFVSADLSQVHIKLRQKIPHPTIRHLILDQVLPRILSQHGSYVLHAGAIEIDELAIAIVGDAGFGKSTLIASFYSTGASVVSDDAIVFCEGLEMPKILPTYAGMRVFPDTLNELRLSEKNLLPVAHYLSKVRIDIGINSRGAFKPLPLGAMFFLEDPSAGMKRRVEISPLSAREVCLRLMENGYRLDVKDVARTSHLFDIACHVSNRVPAFSLTYKRDYSVLEEVRNAVLGSRSLWFDAQSVRNRSENAQA